MTSKAKAALKSPTPASKRSTPVASTISPSLVREELQKMIASRTLSQSKRLTRFLTFIVEKALAQRGDELNEYLIGVEVYERPTSFDPQIDTIVRSEARRLRMKLHEYYDTEGVHDAVVIDVPKGAYAPIFRESARGVWDKQVGQQVSHYQLLKKLGEGGMGTIYLAEDLMLNRTVALKFLGDRFLKDESLRSRFFREARAAATIDHPNVCTVYEADETEGQPFLAMAYIEGQTLEDRIANGALELTHVLDIARQLADGLHAAHQQGVVHRDLKPGNVIVGGEDTVRARIIDFGVAQLSSASRLTEPGAVLGTSGYVSPEQANGGVTDHRADLWSLGVILYEMATGKRPFAGKSREAVLYAIMHGSPEPMNHFRDGIPVQLETIVSRCLDKDPARRYPDAAALSVELKRLVEALPRPATAPVSRLPSKIPQDKPPQPARIRPGAVSSKRRWVLIGAAALLLVATSSYYWIPGNQVERRQPTSASASVPRLAVLPFESRTPGEESQALSYAITDSLITRLARLSRLRVTSWTSVRHLTERKAALPEIAKVLKVDYILEGSFLKSSEGFRVNVQCIRTADESPVWSEEFAASWKDIFAVQKQVSEGVVRQVNAQLNSRDRQVLASLSPRDSRAYEAYAQGHYDLTKYDLLFQPKYLQDAESRLKEALRIDPDYSDALADLGRLCYHQLYPQRDDTMKMVAEGTRYLERALALDPENVEAHCWLAAIYGFVGLSEKALELSRRAVDLGPNNPQAHMSLSDRFREMGFYEAAVAENDRAALSDNLDLWAYLYKASHLLELGDLEAALSTIKQAEGVEPTSPFLDFARGNIAFFRGDLSQAESEWHRLLQMPPARARATQIAEVGLALVAVRRGELEEGRRVLNKFRDRSGFGNNHLIRLAASVGEEELAIQWVRRSQYYRNYRWIVRDPDMATLSSNPAFRQLLDELYARWLRDVAQLGSSFPSLPPKLPTPQAYLAKKSN